MQEQPPSTILIYQNSSDSFKVAVRLQNKPMETAYNVHAAV